MKTIKAESSGVYESKGSKFLSFLMPIEIYEKRLKELKNEHPKAVHFVSASRILNEHNQIIEQSSDDGEPKGSSGVPVLNVLRGNEIINCALIVVRYFGGTLLGVGGLVRAYTNAAISSLDSSFKENNITEFKKYENLRIFAPFSKINNTQYLLKKENLNFKEIFLDSGCEFVVSAPKDVLENLKQKLDFEIKIIESSTELDSAIIADF